jgi:hypothetical protein
LAYGREVVRYFGLCKDKENPLIWMPSIGMKLNIIEPFLNVVADGFKGDVYGAVKIKENQIRIRLMGEEAFVSGGSFRVELSQYNLSFDDKITFTENESGVDRLRLYDDLADNIAFWMVVFTMVLRIL